MNQKNILLAGIIILIIIIIFFIQQNSSSEVIQGEEIWVNDNSERVANKENKYQKAVELVEPNGYINVENITISESIGKNVILLDFWTYTCINCQRTLPYLTAWDEKYRDKGLVIIGIHTPEFAFEKEYDNVKKAVEKFGIKYPVVLDNDYLTWRAYGNRYWPRKYLIDIDGFVVYDHIGEGGYEETERKIQEALEERNQVRAMGEEIDKDLSQVEAEQPKFGGLTKEVYFGYKFSREQLGNKKGLQPEKIISYSAPEKMEKGKFYLNGEWRNGPDGMDLLSEGNIFLKYFAKNVNIVAGSEEPVEIEIFVDGKERGKLTISGFDLYEVVKGEDYGEHSLEIRSPKGLNAYTFTFG